MSHTNRVRLGRPVNLKLGGNRAVAWPPIIATRYVSLLLPQIPGSKYSQKKLISNTGVKGVHIKHHESLSIGYLVTAFLSNLNQSRGNNSCTTDATVIHI